MDNEEFSDEKWEVASGQCPNCDRSFLSLHPLNTRQPVECKCSNPNLYFTDAFPVILHKIGETYHLRIGTGNQETDNISTATVGSGLSLEEAFASLIHKLKS